ncbi:MAG: hypothetical protein HYZ11_01335 [Candidatus Tectomicrobia bacterium]|uniref:Uncharacterized protein n=1 Tax=Tectimicrobiota bacterium TaxID=2528274 RepID=A0A932HVX9_UNCTE|nr:hypothetical protein [Candidatus Tectomicrobia bacterium]
MDLRVPGRPWPQPPYAESGPARPGGRTPAPFAAGPLVLDLEPLDEGAALFHPSPAQGTPPAGIHPHRGRLIDIQI